MLMRVGKTWRQCTAYEYIVVERNKNRGGGWRCPKYGTWSFSSARRLECVASIFVVPVLMVLGWHTRWVDAAAASADDY